MKKEFSADLIARQRLLMEREQAQDIEKNWLTTNQQTGLARGNPFTQSGKARMEANKAGKQYNQLPPDQQQAFRQQMESQNISMNPQGTKQLSAGSGRGTKHGFAGSLANSMMNVHNTKQRESMQNQFAGMGGNPANASTGNNTGGTGGTGGTGNTGSTGSTGNTGNTGSTGGTGGTGGTGNTGSTSNAGTQSPPSANQNPLPNQTPPRIQPNPQGGGGNQNPLPNQTPPRIQPNPQGGGGGNPPQPNPQGGGGGNPPQPNPQGGGGGNQPPAPQGQAPQGQAPPQNQMQQGGNNQMQQMAQNYGAAQDMATLQQGRQGKETWLRNADGSMKGLGKLGASAVGAALTGGLSLGVGAGMRALRNQGVNQQNQQFDQAAARMNQRAMGGNPMMQYKASQESADRIYSSIEHIGIRKSISKKDKTLEGLPTIFDLTEDDVSEEEMHNQRVIEEIFGVPYEQAVDMIMAEERRQAEMSVGGATAPNPMIPDYIKDKEAKDSTKARVRDMVEDSKSEEKGE